MAEADSDAPSDARNVSAARADLLFRKEVAHRHTDRLEGDVIVSIPRSWRTAGMAIFCVVATAMMVLATLPYARSVTVGGEIVPSKGLSAIVPPRAGNLERLLVTVGSPVRARQIVATVRSNDLLAGGAAATARTDAEIAAQQAQVTAQMRSTVTESLAQLGKGRSELRGADLQIAQLEDQVRLQTALIASAEKEVASAEAIAERGFVSSRELRTRRDAMLLRRQELGRLNLELIARRAERLQVLAALKVIDAQSARQLATLTATAAELNQRSISAQSQSGYALAAPVDGTVSAISAREGQAVDATRSLLNIIPRQSALQAELIVPTDRIAFVRPGLDVRLAIDAFPLQRFGGVSGRVLTVAGSAVQRGDDGNAFFYTVVVGIDRSTIRAFGREEPLRPGMTLRARIRSERQSLIGWLFEPLLAAVR